MAFGVKWRIVCLDDWDKACQKSGSLRKEQDYEGM